MLKKVQRSANLVRNMGMRYVAFRVKYALQTKAGLLKKKFPTTPPQVAFLSLEEWRKNAKPFFFESREALRIPKVRHADLEKRYEEYKAGTFLFFNGGKLDIGADYDWMKNPDSGFCYDRNKHWTEIQDYAAAAGDIKFVWEKSRFSFLEDIIRYDYHFGQDCAADVFREIASWIDANPINCGPNFKCSQEISLRTLNWIFALYYYRNSPVLTEALFRKIMHVVYWNIHHVYNNIHFSRISVRNNHAITETPTLYLAGLLFPEMGEISKWKAAGKKWFEEEIAYQIYEDGTFLQFSMNYHRVVVQLLTWALRLAEINGESVAPVVKARAEKSLQFLYTCINTADGWLPNYGANDGALFFRLSSTDYRDYRPQLEALAQALGKTLEGCEGFGEDALWYGFSPKSLPKIRLENGIHTFPNGGYYVIRESDTLTFLRCGSHKDRPGQADNLHLDLWHQGKNILIDGGSYKYNTDEATLRYFMGTASHNTVQLGDADQMQKGGRFIWYYWTQTAGQPTLKEEADRYVFSGAIHAFQHLGKDILHRRNVVKKKGEPIWEIEDVVENAPAGVPLRQLWHTPPESPLEIIAETNGISVERVPCDVSNYYGQKSPAQMTVISGNTAVIRTTLRG